MIAAQLIFNGIIAGAIYSLVASGFSLIYSVSKLMHFAHGAVVASALFHVRIANKSWFGFLPL